MAGYFKKRRTAGPSKNEQKLQRAESADRAARQAGVVGTRFPSVKRLRLQLDFTSPQGAILESRAIALEANDPAALVVPCPGRCGQGQFDLSTAIGRAVESAQPEAEASVACPATLYGSSDPCGSTLRCHIQIEYRAPAPAV